VAVLGERAALDVGRVVQGTFSVIGRNFVTFLVLSLIFAGLPSLLTTLGLTQMRAVGPTTFNMPQWSVLIPSWLVAIVANSVLQGALVHATVTDMNGRRASVADCLATGLRHFLPLIGIGILSALGIAAGAVLLLVPGIMLACAWCLAVPSEVVERTTVFSSFRRSRDLTRGNRWRIFALFALYVILSGVIQSVLGGVFAGAISSSSSVLLVITPLIAVINSMIGATGVGVLYSEIRQARDGIGAAELAAVFD
jgi:hypothetical protein